MTLPALGAVTANESLGALRQLIARPSTERSRPYWLLDQSALPQRGWLGRNIGRAEWIDLLGGASQDRLNGASPIIVSAVGRNEAANLHFAEQLYGVGRFANAIGLIDSELPIAELQATMGRRARVDLSGNLEAVLRYFDTRTLPLLPKLLSASQYANFMEGLQRWAYLDRWGDVNSLPPADASVVPAAASNRLVLDEAQEAMLIDDGLTDAVIDLLLTQQHPAVQERSPPEQFDLIDPWVDAARAVGLREPFEALAFVGKAVAEGTEFCRSEWWRTRLNDYLQQRCSIEEVFA